MLFTVDILDRTYIAVDTARLELTARSWEGAAIGGPTLAVIEATGDVSALWATTAMLGYHVRIRNDAGTPVWWGMITGAQVMTGGASVSLALDDMRNRINVDYAFTDNDGAAQDGETGWAEHAASVRTYGAWEERVPLADTTPADATTKRDTWLKRTALPGPGVEWRGGDVGVRFDCRGYWSLLDNVYYPNALGKVEYDENTNIEHMLGWSLTAQWAIGFARKVAPMRIHDLKARFYDLTVGTQLDVTGSVLNNRTFTVTEVPSKPDADHVEYVTNDIFFSSDDEMYDNNKGFDVLTAGEMIYVSRYPTGTALNEGAYFLQGVDPHNIEVWPSTVLDEGTGLTIQFEQGHSLQVDEAVENEFPSAATVTLASRGVRVAESFQTGAPTAWLAHEVMVRAKKVGAPPGPLYVRIYADSAGVPGASLVESSIAAADVRTVLEWVTVKFPTPYLLQPATTYWIAVGGTTPGADCYTVGLTDDEDAQYAGGVCKVQLDGGSWVDRWDESPVSMPFQVWGHSDICNQVKAFAAYALPDFACVVRTNSGVLQRMWRDGKTRAGNEAQTLIDTGDANANRISVQVTPERMVIVGMEPELEGSNSADCLHYDVLTGELRRADGGPAEAGVLPTGQIVYLDNVETAGAPLSDTRRIFVERATFDAKDERLSLEPKGRRSPWESQ